MADSEDDDMMNFAIVCVLVAAIMLIWAHLAARAELIRPDNCAFLEEAIAIIEARMPRISEDELRTLELLKEWRRRHDCDAKLGCKAKDGEECL